MALNPSRSSNMEQLAMKGLTVICQKIKTSRDLDHAHLGAVCYHRTTQSRWRNPRTPRSVNREPHICIWGASNSLASALPTVIRNFVNFGLQTAKKDLYIYSPSVNVVWCFLASLRIKRSLSSTQPNFATCCEVSHTCKRT